MNQISLASLMMYLNMNKTKEVDESMVRHMILNSIRMYRTNFKQEFGEVVLAWDSKHYWRRDYFPQYKAGRKKGVWWKYKVDPMQLDAVLIYAKGGSGRRAGLYTDYSFALWKDKELIKFASAYSGLTNIEIKELDKWIRKNTIEKFGPVRSLKPEMVFEISFEKIQISKRHKSGIAVRFPRITKWRKDKKINDADSLENAFELMKKIS